MNKYIALAGLACGTLLSTHVSAGDLDYYIAGRVAFVDLHNDAYNGAVFQGGGMLFPNTIIDDTISDNVAGFRAAIGLRKQMPAIKGALRAELEYGYNTNAKEKGNSPLNAWTQNVNLSWAQKTRSQTVMVNGYYDLKTQTPLTPYIGGGLGYAKLKTSATGQIENINVGGSVVNMPFSGSEDRGNFAWNLQAGFSYQINDCLAAEVGYRYTHLGYTKASSISASGTTTAKYKVATHEVGIGLRYHF